MLRLLLENYPQIRTLIGHKIIAKTAIIKRIEPIKQPGFLLRPASIIFSRKPFLPFTITQPSSNLGLCFLSGFQFPSVLIILLFSNLSKVIFGRLPADICFEIIFMKFL